MAILYAYHSSQIDVDQVNQRINALLRVHHHLLPFLGAHPSPLKEPAFPDLPHFSSLRTELPIIAGQLQAVPAAPPLAIAVPPLYIVVAT